ncbi:hypothetical protein BSKO_09065 [Bryopsis sp. KO-2023]|nr:hypothetical protein BSKO_09065 [Bryopsis sp. KO-2023]
MASSSPVVAAEPTTSTKDVDRLVQIVPLGAGQEVGRSCIILSYRGRNVMFDCGIHPGHNGLASLPLFDHVDMSKVDVCLVTHFHLDHCAAVPYLIGHSGFKGRLFMTHPTKAIYRTLISDFLKVSQGGDDQLYGDVDLENSIERVEVIDFNQTIDIDGIKVCAYRAGHVLGAAMFMVEIGGMRALYTGDYSRIPDRHLPGADLPQVRPDIVIVESTYGVRNHLPRQEREQNFLKKVRAILDRGGNVLLPVVALGRAQEMLLMLDEDWSTNPDVQSVPIYQASGLAMKALSVYQTYIEMMNDDIKRAFQVRNPFNFKFVKHLRSLSEFNDSSPSIVLATPSMLQSGISRELFDMWCSDSRHGVIIADFAVQGTLARQILESPVDVVNKDGLKVPLKMSVDAISFSAHADFDQTSKFLDLLRPSNIVLVHGEANEMARLRKALERQGTAAGIEWAVHTPKVAQSIDVVHSASQTAKVVGELADKPPIAGRKLKGLLVKEGFDTTMMHPSDLTTFTGLHTGRITHRQALPFSGSFEDLRLALEMIFDGVDFGGTHIGNIKRMKTGDKGCGEAIMINGLVGLTHMPGDSAEGYDSHVVLEWQGGPMGDMVADAIIAALLQATGEFPELANAEKKRRNCLSKGDVHGTQLAELEMLHQLMKAQYGEAEMNEVEGTVSLKANDMHVLIENWSGKVDCEDPTVKARIQKTVDRFQEALKPCSLDIEDE